MTKNEQRIILAASLEENVAQRVHAASWSNVNDPFPESVAAYLTTVFSRPPALPNGENEPVLSDLVAACTPLTRTSMFARKHLGERILFYASAWPAHFELRARGPRRAGASIDFVFALGSSCYATLAEHTSRGEEPFRYLSCHFRDTCQRLSQQFLQ
jgi:hypothetical protein